MLQEARRAAEKEIPRKMALADATCGLQVFKLSLVDKFSGL